VPSTLETAPATPDAPTAATTPASEVAAEQTWTMNRALNQALADAMAEDDDVLVFGEDVAALGGVFRVTDGLAARFGDGRCFDTPLAEAGIVGVSVGMAMFGRRPVPEVQFDGFVYPAFDQLVSHVAKLRNRTRGTVTMPITLRLPYGGGIGALEHHSESPEAYFAHTAGLRVVTPSSPADAYRLLRAAIASDDPVVFLEPKRRYWGKQTCRLDTTVDVRTLDRAEVVRSGTDATVVAYGPTVKIALDAAERAEEEGTSVEVVDLRTLAPIDEETVHASVRRTGRMVIVHEASGTLGLGAELAASAQSACFYHLEAPVARVTGYDTPYPPAKAEHYWLPDEDRVLEALDEVLTH
jgi:2-oxoisovalerate dehydrogenase E1 component beta subunit